MNKTELRKYIADKRRESARKFGFRQSSYINFKVSKGYFFYLSFSDDEALLIVKPMYADDLWLDIFELTEYEDAPLSWRGLGDEALPGQELRAFSLPVGGLDETSDLTAFFDHIFQESDIEIGHFLEDNPDAGLFIPDEARTDDKDRLLYLVTLINSGRDKEVLSIIRHERLRRPICILRAIFTEDKYSYIKRWAKRNTWIGKLRIKYKPLIDRIIKFQANVRMAIENSHDDTPGYWNIRLLDCGSMMLVGVLPWMLLFWLFPALFFSYVIAVSMILFLGLTFWLDREKRAKRYYREFLRLPSEVQIKWQTGTRIATIAEWIVIFLFFYILKNNPIHK